MGGANVRPRALIIGNFRESTQTPLRPPTTPGFVYLAIALTTLNAETGILNFFVGGSSERLGQTTVLEPGDGIICRGEDVNPSGTGGGGIVLMIRYQRESEGVPG